MIDIEVNYTVLESLFDRFIRSSQNKDGFTTDALEWLGWRLETVMAEQLYEIRFYGDLASSVGHEVSRAGHSVEVGPNVPTETQTEAKVFTVWKGSEKNFSPPLDRLMAWSEAKGLGEGFAYYLQKRIAGKIPDRKGGVSRAGGIRETPGFSFPERTLASPETAILFQEVGERIGKKVIGEVIGGQ